MPSCCSSYVYVTFDENETIACVCVFAVLSVSMVGNVVSLFPLFSSVLLDPSPGYACRASVLTTHASSNQLPDLPSYPEFLKNEVYVIFFKLSILDTLYL